MSAHENISFVHHEHILIDLEMLKSLFIWTYEGQFFVLSVGFILKDNIWCLSEQFYVIVMQWVVRLYVEIIQEL